ncbi:MAG: patatin family protein [Clostridia bacterium]|nr:patatin family protein [Clostridia bacterium]
MRIGLVLEGGAMRGLFTSGVLDVFLSQGITFQGAVGVSAGAAFGCNFKSRQAGRVLRYNTRYCKHPEYCSFSSFLKTGDLYGADFCYRKLPLELDPFDWETWEKDPMPFFAVCTSVRTGKPAYFPCVGDRDRILEIFRASASMPLVSRMVTVDGEKYLDGGISSSIPLEFMEENGYEKNVVILTQPKDYKKSPSHTELLMCLRYGKYPALCRSMAQRHITYNRETAHVLKEEALGKTFVIAPPAPLAVSRTEKDPQKLREAWEEGQKEAMRCLPALKSFLSEA